MILARTLFFVRHGETDWNAEARLQGQRDIPLNAFGRVQAEEVARRLRKLAPDVDALPFISSPLGRTRETMEILRRGLGLPSEGYILDGRWAELGFGEWEGRTWKEVRRAFPDLAACRERNKWGFLPPGGESYEALAQRIAPAVDDLPGRCVLVSHGGVARALLHLLAGVPKDKAPLVDIWQGRVLVFEENGSRWH